jgi:plasmid maintenance system killer protein
MHITFKNDKLERMDAELAFTGGYPPRVVSAFRGRIQLIQAAPQEQALLQLRCLRMEGCGNEASQHSMRVTDDWELIVAFEDSGDGRIAVVEAMVQRTKTKTEESS